MRVLQIGLVAVLSACAHGARPIPATSEIFVHSLSSSEVFQRVLRGLAMKGFRASVVNESAGLITTEPKEFKVSRGMAGIPWPAYLKAQVLISKNDIQTQLSFECAYGDIMSTQRIDCMTNDDEALMEIQKQKKEFNQLLNSLIGK